MGCQGFLLSLVAVLLTLKCATALYGGAYSNCGEHPYAVHIEHHGNTGVPGDSYMCGGTLITQKHVLTAAHCMIARAYTYPAERAVVENIKVHQYKCNDQGQLVHTTPALNVTAMHIREEHLEHGAPDVDIGVLELEEEINYHPFLADTATLPSYEGPVQLQWEQCRRLTLIGAGTVGRSQTDISDWLRQVRVDVIPTPECRWRSDAARQYPNSLQYEDTSKFFCAVDRVTLGGACGGDSGSGSLDYTNGKKIVVGVAAAGPAICSEPNHFNVYASTSAYMDWIKEFILPPYHLKQV